MYSLASKYVPMSVIKLSKFAHCSPTPMMTIFTCSCIYFTIEVLSWCILPACSYEAEVSNHEDVNNIILDY